MIYLEPVNAHIREFNLVRKYLSDSGIKYDMALKSDIRKGKIKISCDDICDGTVEFIHLALKSVGKKIPVVDSYPEELHPYLHRWIWETTIENIPGDYVGFIKPKDSIKLFTGFVSNSIDDRYILKQFSKHNRVYLSQIVEWKSEFRYYVIENKIEAIGNYDGNETIIPDIEIVKEAISKIKNPPAAFCIDFGVLSTGETALVEYNDAYAVGWYLDGDIDIYWKLISTRFKELVA